MTVAIDYTPTLHVLEDNFWFCLHANTESAEVDFGYFDIQSQDWVDDWQVTDVCTECKAIYQQQDYRGGLNEQ